MDTVIRERLEGALDTTRTALRTANIRYTDLAVRDRAVTFTLNDASQAEAARAALGDLLSAGISQTQRDFSFSNDGPRVQVALTERRDFRPSRRVPWSSRSRSSAAVSTRPASTSR